MSSHTDSANAVDSAGILCKNCAEACLSTTQTVATSPGFVRDFIDLLDKRVMVNNPYGKCIYNLKACHGIAKALQMLFPDTNGANVTENRKVAPPSKATIKNVRRFLRSKVKRYTQDEDQSSELPTVEDLLQPGLFSIDDRVPSRLRIRGKEVITPCILPKVIVVAAGLLKRNDELKQTQQDFVLDEDEMLNLEHGKYCESVYTGDTPRIATVVAEHCIIPGGPWSIYHTICGGAFVNNEEEGASKESTPYEKMRAEFLRLHNDGLPEEDPTTRSIPRLDLQNFVYKKMD